MRISNAEQEAHPWRIREITADFRLEDAWALPVEGAARDFDDLVEVMSCLDPTRTGSTASRWLFDLRLRLGRWFGWDEDDPGRLAIPGSRDRSLSDRLPADLRNTARDLRPGSAALESLGVHFVPLYRTDTESAAEISNRTVHGVLHLGWVDQGKGRFRGQMAVYVKPRGPLGAGYMALIKPFRHWVVYPALLRQVEKEWKARRQARRKG